MDKKSKAEAKIEKLTSPCAGISDSELLLRVNQSVYTLEQLEKKIKSIKVQTLGALVSFDEYFQEYLSRFGETNAVELDSFYINFKQSICDVLDNLEAVLDYSRKNTNEIDVIADAINTHNEQFNLNKDGK